MASTATKDQFILIKVNNAGELAKTKGGSLAALANTFAPQTIANEVYSSIKDQLGQEFQKQGVNADVSIVSNLQPNWILGQPSSELLLGASLGLGVAVLGLVTWRIFR